MKKYKYRKNKVTYILLVCLVFMGSFPLLIGSFFTLNRIEQELKNQAFAKLEAVKEIKKSRIEDYFSLMKSQIITLSDDHMTRNAAKEFTAAFFKIKEEYGEKYKKNESSFERALSGRYQYQIRNTKGAESSLLSRWMPDNEHGRILQSLYISENRHEIGAKENLNDPDDGSTYSKIHNHNHPNFRHFLKEFGYYDILIVEPKRGYIVYSVFKEVDFATSLFSGPYKNSNFARIVKKAVRASNSDTVFIADFEAYEPSYNKPASFIASPIFDNNKIIGALCFQLPINKINAIMGQRKGMGKTGETYLVGQDRLMRSDSHIDSEHYSIEASFASPEKGSINTKASKAALAGKAGTEIIIDYKGNSVLSSYSPINLLGLNWAIISEMDEAEAFASIKAIRLVVFTILILGLVIIIVVAGIIAKNISSQMEEISKQEWIKTGQTKLNGLIYGKENLSEICRHIITFLSEYLEVEMGLMYVVDENDSNLFKYISGYAVYEEEPNLQKEFRAGEGLVGQAILKREKIYLSQVPDSYIKIKSSLGHSLPKSILFLPLIFEENIVGVIELGTVKQLTAQQLQFAGLISQNIAVIINSSQFNAKIKDLLEQTQIQTEELESQQEELRQTNEELEEQTEALKKSEIKLQIRSGELEITNQEVKEKARALQITSKYKSEFLANMSHELRTPLNSMLLLSKMLANNKENNFTEEQIECASSINRSGQNLLYLINDILDLSKIEAGKIDIYVTKVNVSMMCKNINTEFKHKAKEKNLEFKIKLSDAIPDCIDTDMHRLEQVIRNLLSNSLKFTETGSINVELKRPSEGVVLASKELDKNKAIAISVSDTGIGIPEEKQKNIFEAFKQVDGSISRKYGGTGLGLSISRELIHLLGGEIHLQSREGNGTCFTIYIPETTKTSVSPTPMETISQSVPPDDKSEQTLPEDATQNEMKGKILLIIEDDKEFSKILKNISSERGYHCILAHNGETGLRYAYKYKPEGIILDIGLPDINGWKILEELKSNSSTRHIPVHIMSASDQQKDAEKKGIAGYSVKPVNQEQILEALGKLESISESKIKEVLVVEDDDDIIKIVEALIGKADVALTPARSGNEAYELLKEKRFNCIILDLGLPDISGFELLDKIGSDVAIPQTPVVVYTGRNLSQEETEHLNKYAASVIVKSAGSMGRLLDETSLFLHRVDKNLPEEQNRIFHKIHGKDSILDGKKVMVVDDDMRNAFALSSFLKSYGMNTIIAQNGKKALGLLEENDDINIVLMDIMMPVMNGHETMRRIRAIKKYKKLPILALTAKAMKSDREECIQSGANDYLSKPVDDEKLLSMLRVWLYK